MAEMVSTSRMATAWPRFYTVVGLCVLVQVLAYFDRVMISIAALAMQQDFGWSETTKGYVLSAFFVGYMGMQIIGGWLANRYGGRAVLGVCLLLWSLFTLITPLAASVSLPVLIAVRILMGAGEAGLSPSALNLICRWAPEVVRARSIALFSSAASLGTLAALLLTGMIAQAYGWQMAFYIFGVLGMMLAIIWFRVIYDSPQQHPGISAAELEEAPVLEESADKAIPWRLIFTSRATWAIFITYFCVNWSLYVFIAWLPSYFAKAQSLNFSEAGFFSALPWLSMAVFMVIGGWLSDYLIVKKVRVLTVRKLLTCGGLLGSGCAIFFMPMASSPLMAMLLMSGALSIVAFSYSGVVTNILDCLPEYSDVVFGVTNTLGSLPGIVGIAIAGWLVDTTGSYNSVFYLTLSVQITGAIVFFLFSQDKKLVKAATRKKLGAVLDK